MPEHQPESTTCGGSQHPAHGVVDLRIWLESWPYDPRSNVRLQRGLTGREIILVRRPLGLDQYELDGRPDGRHVGGMATALDYHHARLSSARQTHEGSLFELSSAECEELFDEARVFYHRLVVLFRIQDWIRAERDASQILRLLDSVRQHAQCADDRARLEPWRPDLLRLRSVARALHLASQGKCCEILQHLRDFAGLWDALDESALEQGKIEQRLLDSVRDALTGPPAPPPPQDSLFLRQNDYWKIQYQGQTAFLKHMRGLQCLAWLLRHPRREFHVSELLVSLLETPPATAVSNPAVTTQHYGDLAITAGLGNGIPILDAQAKMEYKRRLNDLRQDLQEAEQANDPHRAAQAQDELNAIAEHLASAIGLGGRDRTTSSASERARCAVTKRIKKAIHKIEEAIPPLGHHLAPRIKTGYFCSYHPMAADQPPVWKF